MPPPSLSRFAFKSLEQSLVSLAQSPLSYGHSFGEVLGVIMVGFPLHGHVIRQKLDGRYLQGREEPLLDARDPDSVVVDLVRPVGHAYHLDSAILCN
jgi:hypothetical protein